MFTEIRTEDVRYEEIRKAIIDDAGQKLFNKYYQATGKRWLDIARVLDKIYTHNKHFVLTSAVHKIKWGVHPYETDDPKFNHLLGLIEEELLRDGEASREWIKWRTFQSVLANVAESMVSYGNSGLKTHFRTHHRYLHDRTKFEIRFSKSVSSRLRWDTDSWKSYKDAVELLVPSAETWDHKQWGNDLVLAHEIEDLYGVNFAESWESQEQFDRMIDLIRAWRRYKSLADVYWYSTKVPDLPDCIVRRIWPDNTVNVLADILIDGYNVLIEYEKSGDPFADYKIDPIHMLGPFDRAAFKCSWVFKYVCDCYCRDMYEGKVRTELRAIIFNIEMTAN